MTRAMLAGVAATLIAVAAFAQTDTTRTDASEEASVKAGAAEETFGTNWPLSIATTFFAEADSVTLRSPEDLSGAWLSLSPEDRAMILSDCAAFMAVHGDPAADGALATEMDAEADAGLGTTAPAPNPAESESESEPKPDSVEPEGTIAAAVGYDITEMKVICAAAAKL